MANITKEMVGETATSSYYQKRKENRIKKRLAEIEGLLKVLGYCK